MRLCTVFLIVSLWISSFGALSAQTRSIASGGEAGSTSALLVAGFVEWAHLTSSRFAIKAKLDTGAKSSSVNAVDVAQFKRGNESWVRFQLQNSRGEKLIIERPIVRVARIRRASAEISERQVVTLEICIAGRTGEAEFTLADRTGMNYDLLIGRSFLSSRLLVDSGAQFLGTGKCH